MSRTKTPENPWIGIDLASGPDKTAMYIYAQSHWFEFKPTFKPGDVMPELNVLDLHKRPDGVWKLPK